MYSPFIPRNILVSVAGWKKNNCQECGPRVHTMANKKMKKLLHTAALCVVTYYPEFKNYYERKIKEGKLKILILNNLRNKIILRIAAVIKNNKPYKTAA